MLHFDVAFPSNPEDEGFYGAQEDLNEILDANNPIFAYLSQRILEDEIYLDAGGTVDDVRQIFIDFYDQVGREPPKYFPKAPANRQYNIGKRKWRQVFEREDVVFDRRGDPLIADFDLEPHELYSYRKTLPTKMRPEKSGRNIIIKNPNDFEEWLEMGKLGVADGEKNDADTDTSGGLLSRLFG